MSDFEKLINASDLIEWIMETYPDWCVGDVRSIVDHVEKLPSAQPEIISTPSYTTSTEEPVEYAPIVRCKDCKHRPTEDEDGEPDFPTNRCPCQCDDYYYSWMPKDDWFCAEAERREE